VCAWPEPRRASPLAAAHADATVKLGADSGALEFQPSTLTVKSGEAITFVNNAG
jgi:plastocyanin